MARKSLSDIRNQAEQLSKRLDAISQKPKEPIQSQQSQEPIIVAPAHIDNPIQSTSTQIDSIIAELQSARAAAEQLQQDFDAYKSSSVPKSDYEALQTEITALRGRLQTAESNYNTQLAQFESKITTMQESFARTRADLEGEAMRKQMDALKHVSAADEKILALESQLRGLSNIASTPDFSEYTSKIAEQAKSLEELKAKNTQAAKNSESTERELATLKTDLEEKIKTITAQNGLLQSQIDKIESQDKETSRLKENLSLTTGKLDKISKEASANAATVESLMKTLGKVNNEAKEHTERFERLKSKYEAIEADYNDINLLYSELKKKTETIEEELKDEQEAHRIDVELLSASKLSMYAHASKEKEEELKKSTQEDKQRAKKAHEQQKKYLEKVKLSITSMQREGLLTRLLFGVGDKKTETTQILSFAVYSNDEQAYRLIAKKANECKATPKDNKNAKILYDQGIKFEQEKEYEKAKISFEQALPYSFGTKESILILRELSVISARLNEPKEALSYAKIAKEAMQEQTVNWYVKYSVNMAIAKAELLLGNEQNASQKLEDALREIPEKERLSYKVELGL